MNAGIKFIELTRDEMNIVLGERLCCWQITKKLSKSAGRLYESSRLDGLFFDLMKSISYLADRNRFVIGRILDRTDNFESVLFQNDTGCMKQFPV